MRICTQPFNDAGNTIHINQYEVGKLDSCQSAMATKLKRGRPRQQFFSELDAIIEEAEAITLGHPPTSTTKEKKRETAKMCTSDSTTDAKKRETAKCTTDREAKKRGTAICRGKQLHSDDDDVHFDREKTSICCEGKRLFSELDDGDDDFDGDESKSTPLTSVLESGTILATQLNTFVPSGFRKRNDYIALVLDEIGLQLPSPLNLPRNIEHLLGQPPLEYLWKVEHGCMILFN